MLVLGIDVETTGLDVSKDVVTEVAAVMWDTDLKIPVKILSEIIDIGEKEVSPEASEISGLTREICSKYGAPLVTALCELATLMEKADMILAHNAPFDKGMVEAAFKSQNLDDLQMPEKLWADSSCDVQYPEKMATRKLTYLAAEHNFVNPLAHRALFDVMTMFQIVDRYDWDLIKKWAETPNLEVRANVSYHDREKAKARGYRWNAEEKVWVKQVKEFDLEKEKQEADFPVTVREV